MGPSRPDAVPRSLGFSLIELLTVLAVAGVLTALALPALRALIDVHAVDQAAAALARATRLAKTEAMKRGEVVTVCARDASQGDAGLACVPKGKDWSGGLVVYVDRGDRGTLDDEDLVLQVEQPPAYAPQVLATLRYMSFQASGISLNAASHFDYRPAGASVDAGEPAGSRRLCINKPGRVRMVDITQACG